MRPACSVRHNVLEGARGNTHGFISLTARKCCAGVAALPTLPTQEQPHTGPAHPMPLGSAPLRPVPQASAVAPGTLPARRARALTLPHFPPACPRPASQP